MTPGSRCPKRETLVEGAMGTRRPLRNVLDAIRSYLPEGGNLPARDWDARHRFILALIFGHAVGLSLFGFLQGWAAPYALGEPALIGLIGLVAAVPRLGRRFRSGAAALALVTCSAVFVQFWGGYVEGHFHFFIVVAIVVLYQDWVPFLLTIAYVALDHGIIGTLAPLWVYNHPDAIANPWKWAFFHALLVLGECVALIYAWRMSEATRSQVDLLMRAAGEGIIGVDTQGRVAFANPAAATMTGRRVEEILGKPLEQVLGSGPPSRFRVDGATASNHAADEHVLQRPDGSKIPVNWVASPVVDHGRLTGHVVTLMDATHQKQAEEERRKRIEQVTEVERLKQLDQFKTLFINTAAHELHTPLTPLRLNVYVLKEGHKGVLNAGQKEVVNVLERNVERLSLLVEDVLNAARIQGNRLTIQKQPVDLGHLALDSAASFRAQAERAGIHFQTRIDPGVWVDGDARRLGQAVYNLLDNAFKFTPRGGTIGLEVVRGDGGAILRVRDTGVGLDVADQAKLFQPFSQAHDHMEYTRSGAGLGLYISKGILDVHGGRIGFQSAGRGRGSMVWFELALRETSLIAA